MKSITFSITVLILFFCACNVQNEYSLEKVEIESKGYTFDTIKHNCSGYQYHIVSLKNTLGNLIYRDSIFNITLMNDFYCSKVWPNSSDKFKIITNSDQSDGGDSALEELRTKVGFIKLMLNDSSYFACLKKVENVDALNKFFRENLKIKINKKEDLETAKKWVNKLHFYSDGLWRYNIVFSNDSSWSKLQMRYSIDSINQLISMDYTYLYSELSFYTASCLLDEIDYRAKSSQNTYYVCYMEKSNGISNTFHDAIFEITLFPDSNGFIQVKKRLINPHVIVRNLVIM